jgi:UDP-glucose 4-epimerase
MLQNAKFVLVTGGCGFVGSWVVQELLDRTPVEQVVVVDNLRNGRREFLPESERVVLQDVDLRDGEAIHAIFAETRPDVVIHLGALHFIPYCNAHPAETLHVNVVGTQNVLDACRAFPPASLVIISTAAVYPIADGANREDDPSGPTDIYGLSKAVNEQQLALFARQGNTHCAAARLFNVYGPHETNPHVIPEIVKQMVQGQTVLALGNVKPKRDYVYVTDVARALVTIADGNTHPLRVYNVGTGQEYSVEEIVAELARVSGLPLEIRVAAERVRPADRMHLLCDLRRISSELGWRPRYTLEAGLAELWQTEGKGAAVPQLVAP